MTRVLKTSWARCLAAAALVAATGAPASAQWLPADPVVLGAGRVTVGGDVSATFSCAYGSGTGDCGDDTGFFNYSDYEHSTVRMLRLALNASVRASRQLSFLGEIRSENTGSPQPYAMYARIRPWADRNFDLQIGRVPPTFGAFARRSYASDNILIGYPLAYQYLTSLRTDALPESTDALLRMRGRGWLANYNIGNLAQAHGVPLVSAFRWDTGIQAHAATEWADAAISVTNGSLANPLLRDDNAGKQLAARVAVRPATGLAIGVSAARAPYLSREVMRAVGREADGNDFAQLAYGLDVEYSRDYYLVRGEAIFSQFQLPTIAPTLKADAMMVEGRYKLRPALYVAARYDHLGFNDIVGTARTTAWDAPVSRVETGVGYRLQRNLELKFSVQRNVRDGGRVPHLTIGSLQVGWWF